MKLSRTPTLDAPPHSEAARWVIRLSAENVTPGERESFQKWLAFSDSNRRAYEAAQRAWSTLDLAAGAVDAGHELLSGRLDGEIAGADRIIAARLPGPRRALRHRLVWGAVAGLAAGIIMTLAIVRFGAVEKSNPVVTVEVHETDVGERRRVALADGSVITLNADSEVVTKLTSEIRSVMMIHGEAYFEVAKDRDRPFVVKVGSGTVTAVGTAFNIYHRNNETRVTVLEGEVEVERLAPSIEVQSANSPPSEPVPVRVAELQTVAFDAPDLEPVTLEPAATAAEISWRSGWLVFDAATLAEVVEGIDPYVSARIVIEGDRIAGLTGGGVVRIEDAESILKTIEVIWPIRVTRESPDLIVLTERE